MGPLFSQDQSYISTLKFLNTKFTSEHGKIDNASTNDTAKKIFGSNSME